MASERMLTTAINVIISKIVTCVFAQIFARTVNTFMDHLNQKIVLTDSMLQSVNTVTNVSVVQIVLMLKNVSIVETRVIYYFALIAVVVIIVSVVPISEINHIIFLTYNSQKRNIKEGSKNTKNHQKKSKHQYAIVSKIL